MKVQKQNKSITMRIGVLILMMIFITGCYESKDACIDSRATNYDVSGDINCCCKYPDLSLGIGFFYKKIGFRPQQKYTQGNDTFKIIALDILISEVALLKDTYSSRVDTMINLPLIGGGANVFHDDFGHFKLGASSINIGRFMVVDTFDEINFTIGLDQSKKIDPQNISSQHPLHPDNSGWTAEDGYSFMNMTLLRGDGLKDTVILHVVGDIMSKSVGFKISSPLITERGEDIALNLEFDVSNWIEGIDLIHESPKDLAEQLYAKLEDVIKLRN